MGLSGNVIGHEAILEFDDKSTNACGILTKEIESGWRNASGENSRGKVPNVVAQSTAGLPVPLRSKHLPVVARYAVFDGHQAVDELHQQRFEGERLLFVIDPRFDSAHIPLLVA